MSETLVVTTRGDVEPIASITAQLERLVAEGAVETIDEARKQASAYELYEKRSSNLERERHYGVARLLCEAALGQLSYEDPSVVESPNRRQMYRSLAAVFERGRLLDFIEECGTTTTSQLAWRAVSKGYSYAEIDNRLLTWAVARKEAERLCDLPPATEYVRQREDRKHKQGRDRMRKLEAYRRWVRMTSEKDVSAAARQKGPQFAECYSLLRRTLKAAHDAQGELSPDERRAMQDVFRSLYGAEDSLSDILGMRLPERRETW